MNGKVNDLLWAAAWFCIALPATYFAYSVLSSSDIPHAARMVLAPGFVFILAICWVGAGLNVRDWWKKVTR